MARTDRCSGYGPRPGSFDAVQQINELMKGRVINPDNREQKFFQGV